MNHCHVPELVAQPVPRLRFASYSAEVAARELADSRRDTWRRAAWLSRNGNVSASAVRRAVRNLPDDVAGDVRAEFSLAQRLAARRAAFTRRPPARRQSKGKRRACAAAAPPAAKGSDEPPPQEVRSFAAALSGPDLRSLVDVFRTLNTWHEEAQ